MMIRTGFVLRRFVMSVAVVAFTALFNGCSDETQIHRTLKAVGAPKLRHEALSTYRGQIPKEGALKLPDNTWPPTVRAFQPLSVWAEPDGLYLLLDSDAGGERGVYIPPVIPDKDPLCTLMLTHVKLDEGVYWYQRLR